MISTKGTQCDLLTFAEEHYDLPSLKLEEGHLDSAPREPVLDIKNKQDLERLRGWCREHWTATLKRSFASKNQVFYHSCCNSFSRRAFSKDAGHPAFLSCNVLTMPGFKNVDDAESLFRWFIKLARENSRIGERTLFPSVNRYHNESQDADEETTEDTENTDYLSKRCRELEQELDKSRSLVQHLQADNARLLNSSKSWYSKYQELLEKDDPATLFLATPIKKLKLSNVSSFEDDN